MSTHQIVWCYNISAPLIAIRPSTTPNCNRRRFSHKRAGESLTIPVCESLQFCCSKRFHVPISANLENSISRHTSHLSLTLIFTPPSRYSGYKINQKNIKPLIFKYGGGSGSKTNGYGVNNFTTVVTHQKKIRIKIHRYS